MIFSPVSGTCAASVADGRHWRDFVPAAMPLMLGVTSGLAASISSSGKNDQYAVVAPPWYDRQRTLGLVGEAGGDLVDIGGFTNVVIAHSTAPGFIGALYRAGAWLVIDPVRGRGCLGEGQDAATPPGTV